MTPSNLTDTSRRVHLPDLTLVGKSAALMEKGACPTMPHRIAPVVFWLFRTFDPWTVYGWGAGIVVSTAALPWPTALQWPLGILAGLMGWNFLISVLRSTPAPGKPDTKGDAFLKDMSVLITVVVLQVFGGWAAEQNIPSVPTAIRWLGFAVCVCAIVRELVILDEFAHVPGLRHAISPLREWADRILDARPDRKPRRRPSPPPAA